jgi:hypothetical protein
MSRLDDASAEYDEMKEKYTSLAAEPPGPAERTAERVAALNSALPEIEATSAPRMTALKEVGSILSEIMMLAAGEVCDAALAWYKARNDPDPAPHALFLNAARLDVGVQSLTATSAVVASIAHKQ